MLPFKDFVFVLGKNRKKLKCKENGNFIVVGLFFFCYINKQFKDSFNCSKETKGVMGYM